jgi:hypothetical protein
MFLRPDRKASQAKSASCRAFHSRERSSAWEASGFGAAEFAADAVHHPHGLGDGGGAATEFEEERGECCELVEMRMKAPWNTLPDSGVTSYALSRDPRQRAAE